MVELGANSDQWFGKANMAHMYGNCDGQFSCVCTRLTSNITYYYISKILLSLGNPFQNQLILLVGDVDLKYEYRSQGYFY